MRQQIKTIRELKQAIRGAKKVIVQPRFGCAEMWVKISKADALWLIEGYTDDKSPREQEMSTDDYGTLVNGILALG